MKTLIIGGVAAGAGAAARLRRLDEDAEIILVERGNYISYANCGLPYHLSGAIPKRDSLLVISQAKFSKRFNVDVRTQSMVLSIDATAKSVQIQGPDGAPYTETYDKLLIATGSSPIHMEIPGINDPRITQLWTIPDMDRILQKIDAEAKRAVVVGAGFIGIEVAENLAEKGLDVTMIELAPQVLPTLDPEMSTFAAQSLSNLGVSLELGHKVTAFVKADDALFVEMENGTRIPADLVIMSVGVKPNSELAKAAGLEVGPRGHIIVNEKLQTSNPDIYAAGDAIEVVDPIFGGKTAIPLAGPANKQGRMVADNMVGRHSTYPGSYGAAVVKVGNITAASVGYTESKLKKMNVPYQKIYTHPASQAGYYPGGAQFHIKLIFSLEGKIFGAQMVGPKGVDKRLDVVSVAMQNGMNVRQLAGLELAYAPPFNSAKDPVNFAGMVAQNVLDGDSEIVHSDALPEGAVAIDVREPEEIEVGPIPNALNIPLESLRGRLHELDKKANYIVFCQVGLRGYIAERIMRQHGFKVKNVSGGYLTWKMFHPAPLTPRKKPTACPTACACAISADMPTLDVRAMACPGPVVSLKKKMEELAPGSRLKLLAQTTFEPDLRAWSASTGNTIVSLQIQDTTLEAIVEKKTLDTSLMTPPADTKEDNASIVLFSNDFDRVMATLILACGLAAGGSKVEIFFTFWGLSVLRKNPGPYVKKTLLSRMFGWMLPKGPTQLALSKMHMASLGTAMMKHVMKKQNVTDLPTLLQNARELGVRFVACEMAMNVMGLTREELIEIDDVAGVASFVEHSKKSHPSLFI